MRHDRETAATLARNMVRRIEEVRGYSSMPYNGIDPRPEMAGVEGHAAFGVVVPDELLAALSLISVETDRKVRAYMGPGEQGYDNSGWTALREELAPAVRELLDSTKAIADEYPSDD